MILFLIFGIILVVFIPFAMRSWPAIITLCIAYLIVETGVRIGIAYYSAVDVPRVLVLAGNTWLDLLVYVVPVTVIARMVVLTAKSFGLGGRGLIAANIMGIVSLPGGIGGVAVYEQWERRPAPLQCTSKQIQLVLSGNKGAAVWSRSIALYAGKNISEDGRYLFSPKHRRRICRETSDGTESLNIEVISFKTHRLSLSSCTGQKVTSWERSVCKQWKGDDWRNKPLEVVIFNPNGIRLGDFGIPNNAADDNFKAAKNEFLVSTTGEDYAKITAMCRVATSSNRLVFCRMRRPAFSGVDLYWEARFPQGKIEENLLRSDRFASSVCSSLFGRPLCDAHHRKHP